MAASLLHASTNCTNSRLLPQMVSSMTGDDCTRGFCACPVTVAEETPRTLLAGLLCRHLLRFGLGALLNLGGNLLLTWPEELKPLGPQFPRIPLALVLLRIETFGDALLLLRFLPCLELSTGYTGRPAHSGASGATPPLLFGLLHRSELSIIDSDELGPDAWNIICLRLRLPDQPLENRDSFFFGDRHAALLCVILLQRIA